MFKITRRGAALERAAEQAAAPAQDGVSQSEQGNCSDCVTCGSPQKDLAANTVLKIAAFGMVVGSALGFSTITHDTTTGLEVTAGCAVIAAAVTRSGGPQGPEGPGGFNGLQLQLA
ncbi:hypothetical protein [Kitasatospora sp. NRRL B-11411]|uniref:hypothetical protein n=1 Tax=Kitasatospora sp. NRRL B-11411 TaxID=1463822 RepID=UPI0004C309E9|nr:hypothetical protein [Kitasatospora sp. NRRL B-11411]